MDLKKICGSSIFLKIWKRLIDLNIFGGFEKDLTISNYFVFLKKICLFLIFLSVWKRFLDLKLFLWIDLETINLFKTIAADIKNISFLKKSCWFEKYLLIWETYFVNETSRPLYSTLVLASVKLITKRKNQCTQRLEERIGASYSFIINYSYIKKKITTAVIKMCFLK